MAAGYSLGVAYGKIEIDTSDLTRASAAFTSVGRGMTLLGAAAAAAFGVAIKSAADFEKTIDAAGAVMGKTAAEMRPVAALALKIGQDTKFSAQEVAAGIEELAKAGLTINEITGGAARGMTDLAAAAGDMKLDQAAVIAVNAMKTFSLPASELSRVADSLAGAANASTLEVDDLAVSMRYAGGTAKAMGVSIEEFNTVLAVLGDRGIRGSTAGTSLRGVLLSLSPTSKKASNKMKELGLITEEGTNQFFDATGAMKPMREVMEILGRATANLSEEQKVNAFNTIFQRRAMASALFMAEAGAKGFDQYWQAIERTSATEVAAAKLDNLAGDFEKLKSNIETLLITAGTPFQEQLREWVQGLTKLVQWFADLDSATQKLIMQTLAWTAAIAGGVGILSLFVGQLLKMVRAVRQVGAAMLWLIKGPGKLIQVLDKLKFALFAVRYAIVTSVIPALKAMGAALLANPIILIVAGIAALVAGLVMLYKRWEPLRNLVDGFWQDLQRGWDVVLGLAKALGETLGGALSAVGDFFSTAWRGVKAFFSVLSGGETTGVGGFVGLMERVGLAVHGVVEWFRLAPGRIVNFLTLLPGRVIGLFSDMMGAVSRAVSSGVGAVVDFFAGLPEKIAFGLGFAIGRVIRWGAQLVVAFVEIGAAILGAVVGALVKLPGVVAEVADDAWDLLWEWGLDVLGFFRDLPGRLVGFFDLLWDTLYARVTRGFDRIWDTLWQWGLNVIGFFQDLPGKVVGFVDRMWDTLWDRFFRGKDRLIGIVYGFGTTLFTFFRDLPGNVVRVIGDLAAWIGPTFRNAGIAAWNGIVEWIGKLLDFFSKIPGMLIDALGDVIGAVGRKFTSIGSSMWEGFKKGLFGSPKTKIEYALMDLMEYMKKFNVDAGAEMAKLHAITTGKFGTNPVASLSLMGAGAGGAGNVTNNSVTNQGDHFDISGAETKTSAQIAKDIVYYKRIRSVA